MLKKTGIDLARRKAVFLSFTVCPVFFALNTGGKSGTSKTKDNLNG